MTSFRPTVLLATCFAVVALSGCTTESQTCSKGVCKISMSGKGVTAKLGGEGGSTIELLSASGSEARVKIAGQEGTLKLNEPIRLDNATLTLTEVKDDKIKLRVDTNGESEDATAPEGTTN